MCTSCQILRINEIVESLRDSKFIMEVRQDEKGLLNVKKRFETLGGKYICLRAWTRLLKPFAGGRSLNKLENCLLRTHSLYFTPFKRCHNIIDTHVRVYLSDTLTFHVEKTRSSQP